MNKVKSLHVQILLFALAVILGWSAIFYFPQSAGAADSQDSAPKTLAILPFENNSVTGHDKFEPLTRGLSAMIITDLSDSVKGLKLIEREKIKAILEEISLGQSGIADESTAAMAGKILGAQAITIGSFMVLGKKVRIDIRIINVETGEVITSDSVTGKSNAFMELEQELVRKIADSLNETFEPEKLTKKSDIQAALYFSKGIEAFDNGELKKAKKLFKKCIKLDKSYKTKVNSIMS